MSEAAEIIEGTWAIRVPTPFGGHTNAYLLAEDTGFSLIDTGWGSREGLDALMEGIAQAGFTPDDLNGAAVTHHHYGHAGLLQALNQPNIWCGVHGHELKTLKDIRDGKAPTAGFEVAVPRVPAGTVLLADGARLPLSGRTVRAVWTPGHTFGHTVFVEDHPAGTLLYSGDHVPPEEISPAGRLGLDVSYLSRAVNAYTESLTKLENLPADTLVLPGEGQPFRGLHQRIQQINRARAERTAAVALEAEGAQQNQPPESFARFAALMDTAAHMYAAGIPVSELPSWHNR
ncbi:hypothetical protein HMPREF3172_05495 [Brevibacterium sp. HMSC08F02]|uniref:MBL fold metallo-hydrolase n=1 Tax=Brevibacterium sp. HMSC08F02 TaxID=1581140 RepID=UPI0008A52322|nr:MBL fold metallo-hydrolase [Brevibacterium sp. HMSC08F02]OFT25958.1 hypothetical protein HMPREF3172_05495 [Brevibacterium sp. HMSC08F02]